MLTILSYPLQAQENSLQQNLLKSIISGDSGLDSGLNAKDISNLLDNQDFSDTLPNQKVPSSENSESLKENNTENKGNTTASSTTQIVSNIEKYYQWKHHQQQ